MGTWPCSPYFRASVFTLWSPRANLWTRESFSTYVILLLLLCKGKLSIAKLILSMSFAKEFLAAPISKCPQILEFGSSKKEKKIEKCKLSLVHFTIVLITIQFSQLCNFHSPVEIHSKSPLPHKFLLWKRNAENSLPTKQYI